MCRLSLRPTPEKIGNGGFTVKMHKINWCLEVTNPQMKSETPIAIRATPYFWHEKHMKTLQARQVDLLQLRPSIGRFGPSHGRLVA